MENMQNRKKLTAIAGALAVAIGLTTLGAYAYFTDVTKKDSATGKAGEVEIAPEEISINSARLYMSGNGYDISTGRFFVSNSAWEPATETDKDGQFPIFMSYFHFCNEDYNESGVRNSIQLLEDGTLKCDGCQKTWANRYDLGYEILSQRKRENNVIYYKTGDIYYPVTNYHRTNDGKVVYCADWGKMAPGEKTEWQPVSMEMTNKIEDIKKRILLMGYPNKTLSSSEYSEFANLLDSDFEIATALALWIADNTKYNKYDGSLCLTENIINKDGTTTSVATTPLSEYIDKYYILYPYQANVKIWENSSDSRKEEMIATYSAREESAVKKAEEFKKLLNKLLEYANDTSLDIQEFEFNSSSLDVKPTEGGRLFGPYNINTNITSNINLSTNVDGIEFWNAENNTINSVQGSSEFYVFVPSGIEEKIDITAEASGVSVIPSYYYSNTEGDNTMQKMMIASPVDAKITAHIDTVKELMPGDVIDVSWVVENTANKAVVTRNKVYIYWDNDEDELADKYSNAIESTYIMKQNTNSKSIQKAMFDKTDLSEYLFEQAGEVKEFELDGVTHKGYEFIMMGDWLDGVGNAAETIRPNGTNLHYGEAEGEIDYDSLYDDNSYTTDTISFKIGFSPYANIHTSNKNLRIAVITESIQWQNTIDEEFDTLDWSVIGRTDF